MTLDTLGKKLDELLVLVQAQVAPGPFRRRKVYGSLHTQAEFERLPGLISRDEFMEWTGLDAGYVDEEVGAGRIQVLHLRHYRKYLKSEVARLAGFKM